MVSETIALERRTTNKKITRFEERLKYLEAAEGEIERQLGRADFRATQANMRTQTTTMTVSSIFQLSGFAVMTQREQVARIKLDLKIRARVIELKRQAFEAAAVARDYSWRQADGSTILPPRRPEHGHDE